MSPETEKAKKAQKAAGPKRLTPEQRRQYMTSQEVIIERNYFYRDCYRRLMMVCLTLFILIGFLSFLLMYEFQHPNPPRYFATSPDSTPTLIVPLSQPNLKPAFLLEWAIEGAIAAYTYNFVDYRRSLQNVRVYFTRTGYQSFLSALKESNDLDAVKTKKLLVHAKLDARGTPKILTDSESDPSFRLNGAFAWQVQVPMIVTYEGAGQTPIVQRIILTMLVKRMSSLASPEGVGIDSFVAREITG